MYAVGGKLLNGIRSMYVNIFAFVGVERGESECFWIDSGLSQVCVKSSCPLKV